MKKSISIIKKHIQPLAWLVLVCFCLISPYQFFNQNELADLSQEVEKCVITADEVENFAEYRNSEVHSISTDPIGQFFLAFSATYFVIKSFDQTRTVNLRQDFRQPPNTVLLCVFRI
ncbi:MAG: hypothetical protein KA713_12370 [Chryseotalea sp. WA131a]|nr:MAG: hypothetical protein KA713_12370 [Chryseotalea sp. WA131a]